jgi:uncharacterized protein (TIGR00251 family)
MKFEIMSKKNAIPKREEEPGCLRKPSSCDSRITETLLKVYVQPKSSRNEIVGPYRDGIKVKITAPPIEGKANEGLVQLLAREWGLPPSSIEIVRGHHTREKTLRIQALIPAEFLRDARANRT